MQNETKADYLVAFPRRMVKNPNPDLTYVLDGTPKNNPPKEGDCLGPFFQRVLARNAGQPARKPNQDLTTANVSFCWETATHLRGKRYRMYLKTTKAIKTIERLEALTTYGSSHVIN
jgi:hypothetical protein